MFVDTAHHICNKSVPKNVLAAIGRIKTKVLGKARFDMGFDVDPGRFVLIHPKVTLSGVFDLLLFVFVDTMHHNLHKKFSEKRTRHFLKN